MIGASIALLLAGQAAPATSDISTTMCGRQRSDTLALLRDLQADRSMTTVQRNQKWLATRDGSAVLWTIATEKNPAFPAVICRRIVGDQKTGFSIDSQMICDAPRVACEHARDEITALNEKVRKGLSGK